MADTAGNVAAHPLPAAERIIVTIGVMMAVLLQVLDTTIANVALPHMQASLSATQESINWVLTSYIVASAIALLWRLTQMPEQLMHPRPLFRKTLSTITSRYCSQLST